MYIKIWQQITGKSKSSDLELQYLQKWFQNSFWILSTTGNNVYKYRSENDLGKLILLVKTTIKRFADSAVFLGGANEGKV